MKKLLAIISVAAGLFLASPHAHAQNATVVATCGVETLPVGYAQAPVIMDTTGKLCTNASSAGGSNISYNPADAASSIVTGGTFQQVFASNLSRVGCFIENPVTATEPLYVHWTSASATANNSASLGPGSSFSCGGGGALVTGAISVMASTTGHTFPASGS